MHTKDSTLKWIINSRFPRFLHRATSLFQLQPGVPRDPSTLPVGWGQGGRAGCGWRNSASLTTSIHHPGLRPGVRPWRNGLRPWGNGLHVHAPQGGAFRAYVLLKETGMINFDGSLGVLGGKKKWHFPLLESPAALLEVRRAFAGRHSQRRHPAVCWSAALPRLSGPGGNLSENLMTSTRKWSLSFWGDSHLFWGFPYPSPRPTALFANGFCCLSLTVISLPHHQSPSCLLFSFAWIGDM